MMVVSMTLVEPRPRRRAEASISMESPPVCVDGDAGARAPTLRLLGGAMLGTHHAVPRRLRRLLGYLAIERERDHERTVLASWLWPDEAPDAAMRLLRHHTWLLQQFAAASGIELVLASPAHVRIHPTIVTDVQRISVLHAATSGHCHRRRIGCASCCARLLQLLDVGDGELLAGIVPEHDDAYGAWLHRWREQIHDVRIGALHDLTVDAHLRGDGAAAQVYAQRWIAAEPWNEDAHRMLIELLGRAGRRAAAHRQGRRAATIVEREYGEALEPATRQLLVAVTSGTLGPYVHAHGVSPGLRRPIGRAGICGTIHATIADPAQRLMTLHGIGGAGKTTLLAELVRQLAPQFADGAWFLDVAHGDDRFGMLAALAQAAGVSLTGQHDPLAAVAAAFGDRDLLLALDNVEHVASAATLIEALLGRTTRLVIICAARRRLNLRGELVIAVDGLASSPEDDTHEAPAVALFLTCAQANDLARNWHAEAAAIAQLCRMVGGLPLAIEWLAWLARAVPCDVLVEQFAVHLERAVPGHADGVIDGAPSLHAVFMGVWDALDPAQRRVLQACAVFRAGFSLADLAAILDAPELALRPALTALIDAALVRWQDGCRAYLHPLIAQFTRILAPPDDALTTRHAVRLLGILADPVFGRINPAAYVAAARLRERFDDIAIAWKHAVLVGHWQLARAALPAWYTIATALGWAERIAALMARSACGAAPLVALELWRTEARLRLDLADRAALAQLVVQIQRSAPQPHDPRLGLELEWFVAMVDGLAGERLTEYAAALRRVLVLAGADHDTLRAEVCYRLGRCLMDQGDLAGAQRQLEDSLALMRRHDDWPGTVRVLNSLAQLPARAGDLAGSLPHFDQLLDRARAIGDPRSLALALKNGGVIRALLGIETERAIAALEESEHLVGTLGSVALHIETLHSLAHARLACGHTRHAARALCRAAELALTQSHVPRLLEIIEGFGVLMAQSDEPALASSLLSLVAEHQATDAFTRRRARERLATLDAGLPALVAPEAPEHVLQQLLARVRASAESPPAAPRTAR